MAGTQRSTSLSLAAAALLHVVGAVAVRAPTTVTPATYPVTGDQVFFQQFVGSSCLFSDYTEGPEWIYADEDVAATPEACAAECLSYEGCTGFELYESGVSSYCSLWFGGACTHEDMHSSEDVVTAVLMDGVGRFTNRYCIWTSEFEEGTDYVLLTEHQTWHECLQSCTGSTASAGTELTTVAVASSAPANATTATTTVATTAGVTVGGTGNMSLVSPSNNSTTMAAVDLGACTGIEAVYSSAFEAEPVRDSCAHYYGGACPPSKMDDANSLTYDTARLYSLDAIGQGITNTVGLGEPYHVDTVHTAAHTPEAALDVGYAACNPGSEILRGYDSCSAYVDTFACECADATVGDLCVGNTTAVPDEIWVTSKVMPVGARCSSTLRATVVGATFAECRDSCLADVECSCYVFDTTNGTSATVLGTCALMNGAAVDSSSAWPPEDTGTMTYYTFQIDRDMNDLPLAAICPLECAVTEGCTPPSQWNTLTIVFLCCLIFAIVALACAVGKWIHNMILHRRQRAAAVAERAAMAMSAESINSIKTELFAAATWAEGVGDPECIVCLAEFEEGDKMRVLKCQHRFHVACIDQWLAQQGVCPICKVDLRPEPVRDPLNIQGGGPVRPPAGVANSAEPGDRSQRGGGGEDGAGGGGGGAGAGPGSLSPPPRRRSHRRRRGYNRQPGSSAQVEIEMQERPRAAPREGSALECGSAGEEPIADGAGGGGDPGGDGGSDASDEDAAEFSDSDGPPRSSSVRSISSELGSAQIAVAPAEEE